MHVQDITTAQAVIAFRNELVTADLPGDLVHELVMVVARQLVHDDGVTVKAVPAGPRASLTEMADSQRSIIEALRRGNRGGGHV